MPYLKEYQFCQGVTELIRGKNINSVSLAGILGCSPNTAMKLLRHPEKFSLEQIRIISNKIHIPIERLKEEIK